MGIALTLSWTGPYSHSSRRNPMGDKPIVVRPLNVTLRQNSEAAKGFYKRALMPLTRGTAKPGSQASGLPGAIAPAQAGGVQPSALAPGLRPTPEHDLEFHGGRTIQDLKFVTYYIGGAAAWAASDVTSIDKSLEAAMTDEPLNNVMAHYFNGKITSQFLGSTFLAGPKPGVVSQGDVESLVR